MRFTQFGDIDFRPRVQSLDIIVCNLGLGVEVLKLVGQFDAVVSPVELRMNACPVWWHGIAGLVAFLLNGCKVAVGILEVEVLEVLADECFPV